MEIIKQFFQDDKNRMSMTRLLSFILVVSGIVYIFVYPDHYIAGIEIILFGLGGKIGQKFIENEKRNNNSGHGRRNNKRG